MHPSCWGPHTVKIEVKVVHTPLREDGPGTHNSTSRLALDTLSIENGHKEHTYRKARRGVNPSSCPDISSASLKLERSVYKRIGKVKDYIWVTSVSGSSPVDKGDIQPRE